MFINLCHSEKVAKPIAIQDPFRGGTQWEIPYSLGPAQDDKDKSMNLHLNVFYVLAKDMHIPYDFHLKAIQFNDLFSLHKIDQCAQAKIIIYTRFKFFKVCIKHLETIGFDKIVIRCLVGKECEVHDFIVGTETHQRAKDDKRFKQFLVQTAIEAIEKQRGLQLDPSNAPFAIYNKNIKCTFFVWDLNYVKN